MSLTAKLLQGPPAQPLITHYDDAAGTRVELSVATMRNWAAKTANWLVEEHDIEPGAPVAVLLPAHWQTAAVLLGAWWAGAHVVEDSAGAEIAFVAPGTEAPGATVTAVASLDPMGRDLRGDVPPNAVDYIGDARMFGDDYLEMTPVPGSTPCLNGSTVDEVLARALVRATELGLSKGSRALSTLDWPMNVADGLVTVLAAGASLVQVTNPDQSKLPKHAETERATLRLP